MKIEEIKEGEDFEFKVKNTTYRFTMDSELDMYKFETLTSKSSSHSYVLTKDKDLAFSILTREARKEGKTIDVKKI